MCHFKKNIYLLASGNKFSDRMIRNVNTEQAIKFASINKIIKFKRFKINEMRNAIQMF